MKYTPLRSGGPERSLLAKLARASKGGLISVDGAAAASGLPREKTAARLASLARRGWLERARRGLYMVRPLEAEPGQTATPEDPWVLAREAFSPCYIGGWSAAEHWGFTEQIFRATAVVTAAPVRHTRAEVLGNEFRLFRVPRSRLAAGVVKVWRGPEQVAVSGRERTLIDGLRHPAICGGIRHVAQLFAAYGNSAERDFRELGRIATNAANGAAWKRLGYLVEMLFPRERHLIVSCERHLSAGYSKLDPTVATRGRLLKRWRLWLNVDLEEFANAEPHA